MAWERAEGGRWQKNCASTPRLRRSTFAPMTCERVEGGRWAETLRLNTTLGSLKLGGNGLGVEQEALRRLSQAWGIGEGH